ncbi:MAG: hypothetical protein ABI772_07390 [Bacteroidota bacterium]
MKAKYIYLIIIICYSFTINASSSFLRPKVRVIVEIGHGIECEGTGICSVRLAINLLRPANEVEAQIEYDGNNLILTFNEDEMSDEIHRKFENENVFSIEDDYTLSGELVEKLDLKNERFIKAGKFPIIHSGDLYIVRVPLE